MLNRMKMKRYFLLLTGMFLLCTCKKDDEVYTAGNRKGASLSSIIRVTGISVATLEADTADVSQITLHIDPESDPANRTITVNTTLGNFLNGNKSMTLTADAAGNAVAVIRSPLAGDAQVTATVKSISVDTVVHFKPAPADDLLLTADNYNTDTSGVINVTATLSRNPGRGLPSDPAKVYFTVTPGTGATALVYPAFANTTAHVATAAIKNPFKVPGTFTIEAKTPGDNADTIRRTVTVIIK